jgi:hypothetical protein
MLWCRLLHMPVPKGNQRRPICSAKAECFTDSDFPGILSCLASTSINHCSLLPRGKNAVCIPKNQVALCRCQVGYKKNTSGQCTFMCDGVIFGLNAQCIISNTCPICACSQGTFGHLLGWQLPAGGLFQSGDLKT